MIHILIPVHNRLSYTVSCLKSLKHQILYKQLNIIIFDDGSTDGTSEYLKKNFPEITLLYGDGSNFWGGSVNNGIKYILTISKPNDWILLINNDVELKEDAISQLILTSKKKKRKVIVGSLCLNYLDKKTIIKSGTLVKSWFLNITKHIYENQNYKSIKNFNSVEVDFITGRCLLHPVELFDVVGNYDSNNFIHYGSDDEFSARIKKFGYSTLLCPASVVFLKNEENKILVKKKSIFNALFSIKSSLNIINKFRLTMKIVPPYAKLSFFLIGCFKSLYLYFFKK